MSGLLGTVYNALVKRNAVFLTTIFAGTFAANIAFDVSANKIWDQVNKGRQWKDIKHKYMDAGDDDE
ncbi:ubiquinol-cytochrome C reductase [Sphaerulina musiva SO2202]|uniref:Complex III subunit 9 n=1 Tax=Sphaerulina musiva (strain SO2202) TaxID=692275 RepID=M3AZS5_SPHMS|nr:ubiquinol-cytochrome C reductase [Sphaerulina musiva SO2202]EMF13022.1 ubiquinol-cytochrome C reductase [Sphaerulina musiva SO2202]